MTLPMPAFTLGDACVESLGPALPPPQVPFLRGVLTIAMLGLLARRARALARPHALAMRTAGEVGASFIIVAALQRMPLADATSVLQALPLAVIATSALLLREQMGACRWCAVGFGADRRHADPPPGTGGLRRGVAPRGGGRPRRGVAQDGGAALGPSRALAHECVDVRAHGDGSAAMASVGFDRGLWAGARRPP